jgi:hypothetical protein
VADTSGKGLGEHSDVSVLICPLAAALQRPPLLSSTLADS